MTYQKILMCLATSCFLGCADRSPPPARADIPPSDMRNIPPREYEPAKPLPDPDRDSQVVAPPFDDVPLLNQPVPEAQAFVEAWNRVGRPRVTVFMNRTLEGKVIPVNPADPDVSVDVQRTRNGKKSSDSVDVYLHKGQYDEAYAKSLDYEAMENTLSDWVACNSQVTMVAPMMARQKLTDQQVKELNEGRPQVLRELAQQLDVDVLIHIQAHPTQQSREGLKVRVVAEAINTKGGESLGRAFVDAPLPLEKQSINRYTRFLARKLMDGMIGAWYAPQPDEPKATIETPAPQNVPPPNVAPQSVAPQNVAPQGVAPQNVQPQAVAPLKVNPPTQQSPAVVPAPVQAAPMDLTPTTQPVRPPSTAPSTQQ